MNKLTNKACKIEVTRVNAMLILSGSKSKINTNKMKQTLILNLYIVKKKFPKIEHW